MASFEEANAGRRQDVFQRIVIVLLGFLVALIALSNVPSEFRAHILRAEGVMGPYRERQLDLMSSVASAEGVYAKLQSCDDALSNLSTLLQPKAARTRIANQCLEFANAIVTQAPALSFAHLVRATALSEIGDISGARQALLLSAYAAGDSALSAQRRATLWVKQFGDLSEEEKTALRKDFVRIGFSETGSAWLGGQFVSNVPLRPFITQAVQTLPEARQASFLRTVRRLTQ